MLKDQKYVVISERDVFEEPIGYFLNDAYFEYAVDGWIGKKVENRFVYNGEDFGYFDGATLLLNDGSKFWIRQQS